MLVEKEIIAPGQYWYSDNTVGLPRKLDVTSEMSRYWHEQGTKMLSSGLTIPVPFEHDFSAHPMTPKDKLLNNAGWVQEYKLKDFDDPKRGKVKDALFGVVDIQDDEIAKKLPHTIRWTSPWINSFTDGNGNQWKNVISHLALTLRPRITEQKPFDGVAAALSMASGSSLKDAPSDGFCLSRAGRLVLKDGALMPEFPVAFSVWTGVSLGEFGGKPKGKPGKEKPGGGDPFDDIDDEGDEEYKEEEKVEDKAGEDKTGQIDNPPIGDPRGDVSMEELLCDLLSALGIHCDHSGNEEMFKRSLYTAAMKKIHELTNKAQNPDEPKPGEIGKHMQQQAGKPPAAGANNPLVQQEQQPMYMSIEDINKLPDPMKGVALAMYAENQKLQAQLAANEKTTNSLRDAKLKEASAARSARVALLGKLSPRAKADLDAMVAMPNMALSMGDGGDVVDPMAQTLAVLEKGLADIPRILTMEQSSLSVQPQPSDGEMSADATDELADNMARMMGCPPEKKAS